MQFDIFFLFQKNFNEVVSDCGKALDMNTKYTKALTRRARACEKTNDLTQSLEGEQEDRSGWIQGIALV